MTRLKFLVEKQDDEESEKTKPPLTRMMSQDGHKLSKKLSDVKAAFKLQRFAVHILCEHDEVRVVIVENLLICVPSHY